MIQSLFDGILVGAILSLGAIGLTMIMHILRFANFSHAELLSIGAYSALAFDRLLQALVPALAVKFPALSLTASLVIAIVLAMAMTGLSAIVIDRLVFRRWRDNAAPPTMVFGSFGVALIVRNAIGLIFGLRSQHYGSDIAFAILVSTDPFLLVKPDQLFVLGVTLVLMIGLHLLLSRTPFGFALRAVSENPVLAQVNGINLSRMIRMTWIIGGGIAAVAGILYALNNQLSPVMGRDLTLSLFAAAIVGGIGSIYGAVLGGFLVGLASSLALLVVPAGYNPAIPFLIILVTLYLRPNGLFGEAR